ncbi:MAG: hypothetical protein K6U11_12690 [bacterium]|nr:hypothetical protein [bacterium]
MNKNFLFFFQSASLFTLCMIRKCEWSAYSLTLAIITIALMILSFLVA